MTRARLALTRGVVATRLREHAHREHPRWHSLPGDASAEPAAQPEDADLEELETMLEPEVARKPSLLANLGMSALQVLAAVGETLLLAPEDPREIAVGFTDLEGFTRFTAVRGDLEAAALLRGHYESAEEIVRLRGGRIVKRLGDGLLLSFPDPGSGTLAMLELIEARPVPLLVRGGLHYGEVMAEAGDLLGHVVNVAARITDTARGGELLVTRELREAVELGDAPVAFGRPRRRYLKGVGERVEVLPARHV